jgi:Ca2+-binding EF-hand superfamily protein
MKELLAQFDANQDGRVSRDEFVNGPTRGFDLADANHDGVVTQEELRGALAKAKAMRGQ